MIGSTELARALRKIEAELSSLAGEADKGHPIDPHELRIEAMRLGCQAEILERGLLQ